jgi:dihydrofolate reductase
LKQGPAGCQTFICYLRPKGIVASYPIGGISFVMGPLRYSINVTLDGCCDHRAMFADEELHRHAAENLDQADALLFGRVTYEMMEAAFRGPAQTGARPDWVDPFARRIDAATKYVVSSTLDRIDWNAELVRGDLGKAVQQLKRESGKGLLAGWSSARGRWRCGTSRKVAIGRVSPSRPHQGATGAVPCTASPM